MRGVWCRRPSRGPDGPRVRRRSRPSAPSSSTPACCWPTPARCAGSTSTRWSCPVVVITELEGKRHHPELGLLRPLRPARARRAAGDPRPARRGRPGRRRGRHGPGRAQPHRRRLAAVRLPPRRQRHPDPGGRAQPRQRAATTSRWSPRTCRCGSRRRPSGCDAEEYHGERVSESDPGYSGMAELEVPAADLDELYDDGWTDVEAARDLPCHTGLVLLSERGTRAGPGRRRQAGAPGARRPRGVRHPRPLRRAADRPGDAARPRGRDRLPGRPGRHRQVGDGPVRRARGRPGAPPAPEGRRLPPAVRRRRPGARLPARLGVGEDVALGRRPSSTPWARSPHAT